MSDKEDYSEFWAEALAAPYKTYWEKLGQFVAEFSATEAALLLTIKEFAGLKSDIGSAIVGGVRVHDGISMLNRILDAAGAVRPKERLDPVLHQLGQINATRNNIIHWGTVMVEEGVFLVSNKHLVHSNQIPQQYTVTPDDLSRMTTDLMKIRIHLAVESAKAVLPKVLYKKALRQILRDTWSYKPPRRDALPRPSSQRRSARKRQRQSSPG